MPLQVLYFASVREAIGVDGERVEPPATVTSVAELLDWLAADDERHAAAFADRSRLRAALDQRFVPLEAPLGAASELALFPPVTGG